MKLSDRLEMILKMLGTGNRVLADIGTDHGFTAIEAVRRGLTERAIASDVANGPITAARQHIAEAGLAEVIDARVADGLAGLAPGEADAVIISGMGGDLICRILEAGSDRLPGDVRMILSPQSELFDFRKWILAHGFRIIAEGCLREDGKFYSIMEVRRGPEAEAYEDRELAYGRKELFDPESLKARDENISREILVLTGIYEKLRKKPEGHEGRLKELKEKIQLAKSALI